MLSFSYTSDFVPVFPEARAGRRLTARAQVGVARWWRHRTPGHPVMICVHGYAGGHFWLESLAFDVRRFYRAGVDVVLYVLPYHGTRAPGGPRRSGEPFFDIDLVRTNEAFAQAIYELRALLRHVRAAGAGPVGAFGMSLGGYTTALLASVEPELAFAVPMIPLTALPEMMWAEGEATRGSHAPVEHGWSLAALQDSSRCTRRSPAPARAARAPSHHRARSAIASARRARRRALAALGTSRASTGIRADTSRSSARHRAARGARAPARRRDLPPAERRTSRTRVDDARKRRCQLRTVPSAFRYASRPTSARKRNTWWPGVRKSRCVERELRHLAGALHHVVRARIERLVALERLADDVHHPTSGAGSAPAATKPSATPAAPIRGRRARAGRARAPGRPRGSPARRPGRCRSRGCRGGDDA
jgi:pimeloyl-ACP methyl ester carboxylesterase